MVIPALVIVGLLLAGLLGALSTQQACADAARQAARVLARGDGLPAAAALVRSVGPDGASFRSTMDVDLVRAYVSADVRVGIGRLATTLEITETSVAAIERSW